MSLHMTPEEHDADPPSGWRVEKCAAREWHLIGLHGSTIDTFGTRREAEAAKVDGHAARLYEKEGRWFRGEPVAQWKPYAQAVAERELATCAAARRELTLHLWRVVHRGSELCNAIDGYTTQFDPERTDLEDVIADALSALDKIDPTKTTKEN